MKKLLLVTLSAGALFASASAATLEMSQSVVGLFDDQGYDVPNYYVILSDQSSATYNQKTGTVALEQGYVLSLDLYKQGLEGFLSVANAQVSLLEYTDQLTVARGNAAADLVSLYRALGGGWEILSE